VIEGFYGRPWSWDERLDVMAWCHERGMTDYVYAPKDDPLHRARWRDPYPADELDGFERLASAGTLRLGFALSPGLSIDYGSRDDRDALAAKVDQVVAVGVHLVVLAVDDIPPAPGLGRSHAELTAWLAEHLDGRAEVVLVPTDYTSVRPTPYLDDLASGCPPEVPIAWTGPTVICDQLTAADARHRASALGDRLPLVWDNYPVNDSLMTDRLFLGPLRGRDPALADLTSGWLANPMVQPRASKLPLASVAAFLRGDDPVAAWEADADLLGVRWLAEACDGEAPGALVDALLAADGTTAWDGALADLRSWVTGAPDVSPGALGDEADEWVESAAAECAACLQAIRTLEALRAAGKRAGQEPDPRAATESALVTVALWQAARRSTASTLGPRCGFRPVLSQRDDGHWRFHRASVQEGPNATDRLVTYALGVVDRETAWG
jgi:hyaluronoglucosaminidase